MKVLFALVPMAAWVIFVGVMAACEKREHVCVYPLPPPVLSGRCIGEQYVGSTPTKQTCAYEDYTWTCTWHSVGNLYICDRGARMEALAEKPLVKK